MEKLNQTQQKHTFTSQKKCTATQNTRKLKPGLVASYDIRPGNWEDLFLFRQLINLSLAYIDIYPLTYSPDTHTGPEPPSALPLYWYIRDVTYTQPACGMYRHFTKASFPIWACECVVCADCWWILWWLSCMCVLLNLRMLVLSCSVCSQFSVVCYHALCTAVFWQHSWRRRRKKDHFLSAGFAKLTVNISRIATETVVCPCTILFLLFWLAPLGVHNAIRRHQPPQRAVLGQVDCFVQCEVVGSLIALDGVQPRDNEDARVVCSSYLVGEPLCWTWHLYHHPYVQCAQIWTDTMTGLLLWG